MDGLTGDDLEQDPDTQPARRPSSVTLVLQSRVDHLSNIRQKVERQGQLAALLRDQCKSKRRHHSRHHDCDPFLAIDLLGRLLFVLQVRHLLESDAKVDSACPLCQWWQSFCLLEQHGQLSEEDAIQKRKPAGRGAKTQGRAVGEDFAKDAIEFLFEDGGEHNVDGGACHDGQHEATEGGSRCGGEAVRVRREDWEGSIGFCAGVVPAEVRVLNRFCLVVGG